MGFTVIHVGHNGRQLGEAVPEELEFSVVFKDIGTTSYELNINNRLAKKDYFRPKVTDYLILYNDVLLQGGRHTEVERDELESPHIKVAGREWLDYLDTREFPFNPDAVGEPFIRSNTDIAIIARDMLDVVLAEPNSLAFTYNFTPVGVSGNYKIELGDSQKVWSHFKELSDIYPGFDFMCTPGRIINMAPAQALGGLRDIKFLDTNVDNVKFVSKGPTTTRLVGQGSGTGSRLAKVVHDTTKSALFRRMDHTVDLGELKDATLLQKRTQQEYERESNDIITFGCTFVDPSVNIYDEISVGDTAYVDVDVVYDRIKGNYRLSAMRTTMQGDEPTVELTFEDEIIPL